MRSPGPESVPEAVTWDRVRTSAAEVVIVAPCGYRLDGAFRLTEELVGAGELPPGARQHPVHAPAQHPPRPPHRVWAVDADAYMVRPGPRVVEGCEMLASVLHPDRCGEPNLAMARRLA